MKTILIVVSLIALVSCTKQDQCDCTYYSEESTTASPSWRTTYESKWNECEEQDFGTSVYTHYDGSVTKTHTFVKCK